MPKTRAEVIFDVIKTFDFADYGLDVVEEADFEWASDLAAAIDAVLPSQVIVA